jgi:hypothetical protein
MSGCTSISNGQLIMWWSARHGLRETGPLMLVQFQRGMPTSALILYLISITRYTLNTPHRKTGGALFRIGAHMMPGASALLSLIRRSLQTMRTTTNYPPEITLLRLNILPLPLSLSLSSLPKEKRMLILHLHLLVLPRQDPKKCHLGLDTTQGQGQPRRECHLLR